MSHTPPRFPLSPLPGRRLKDSSLEKLSNLRGRSAPEKKPRCYVPVNCTSWQDLVTQTELPVVFSAPLSVWTLSQRSPDMWAKLPDRRDKPKKMDKRHWQEKETMQGAKEKCNNFPPIGKKLLIQISAQMSFHQGAVPLATLPKTILSIMLYPLTLPNFRKRG